MALSRFVADGGADSAAGNRIASIARRMDSPRGPRRKKVPPFPKIIAAAVLLAGLSAAAPAQDTLKIAIGQRGGWEQCVSELGQNAGIFKKHGLALDIFYTQGGGETIQVVIANAAHIGVAIGFLGTIGAFAKGEIGRASCRERV